ncbi:hypothetical protein NDU88_007314 [Pleurodeles waltl]|uniref:Uncharacterized protein n=1 Tax=Pleurodeles waltl TaxID=8319 RepID=A0AAV7P0H9_PLEWA|nr:hypothetical protein NDU88_007314 [Pleurodeles waltl]
MAYYADEEEQVQDLQEVPLEHQVERRLVEAFGHHVQDSMNWAVIQALRPFTQPLTNFGRRELLDEGSQQARSQSHDTMEVSSLPLQHSGRSSSPETLAQMAASLLHDHEYCGFNPCESTSHFPMSFEPPAEVQESSSSNSEIRGLAKRLSPAQEEAQVSPCILRSTGPSGQNLLLTPEDIIHCRSTEWVPSAEVAHYVQDRLHKGFEKEVCNTLRSECPRPSLVGKVANTLELGPSMATFLKRFAKNPKKVLDRAWCDCQDTFLDLSGPLTKFLIWQSNLKKRICLWIRRSC